MANVIAKANADSDLSGAEAIQLEAAFEQLFIAATFSYISAASSGAAHSTPTDVDYLVNSLRGNPGGIPVWNRKKHLFEGVAPALVNAVDEALAVAAR